MRSTAGFQEVMVPSSLAQMKTAGTVVLPRVIGKPEVGFHTLPVGPAAGGGLRLGGSGIVTLSPTLTRVPS
jgi:hypothetical protein